MCSINIIEKKKKKKEKKYEVEKQRVNIHVEGRFVYKFHYLVFFFFL